jgi:hypothetical protein
MEGKIADPLMRTDCQSDTTKSFWLEPEKPRKPKPTPRTREQQRKDREAVDTRPMWVPPQPPTKQETWFRHTHWAPKRERVREAMTAANCNAAARERFDWCGAEAIIQYSEDKKQVRIKANYCHSRFCEPCMRAKGNLMAANLHKRLNQQAQGRYRFITLTLRHSAAPLAGQIARLYECFRKLRRDKLWKDSQRGGAAILEVKWGKSKSAGETEPPEWHPHLHIVAEGEFIPQATLSNVWNAITGDSFKVDIRALNSAKDATFYVSKYICKGTNNEVWESPDAAKEWIEAMQGVRTAGTYGTWRKYKLLHREPDTTKWITYQTLTDVVRQAATGEKWALSLLNALVNEKQYNPTKERRKKPTNGST